jgi:hypothetical protein
MIIFFSLNWSIKLTSVVKIRECKYKSHVLKINVNIIKKKKREEKFQNFFDSDLLKKPCPTMNGPETLTNSHLSHKTHVQFGALS